MDIRIDYIVYEFLLDIGIPESIAVDSQFFLEVLFLVILCIISDRLAKNIFVKLFILL